MNVNKIITQKIIDRLQEAERTGEKFYWVKPFAKGCPKSFAVAYDTREEYKGINRVLLNFGKASGKEFLTYTKIQNLSKSEKKSYHLRKGCHGHMVVYYNVVPVLDAEGEQKLDTKTGEPMTKTILRYYTVFDREDVVNDKGVNLPTKFPIQQFDHSSEEVQRSLAMAKFNAIVDTYCKKYGITIETIHHGMEAYFMPSKNLIRMPSKENFPNLSSYMATFFHELCHSTMIPLDRQAEEQSMKTYSFEELVAELGSAILMAELGMPTEQTESNNLAYLQGWSKYLSEQSNVLVRAASQAEKASELIMSEFELQLAQIQGKQKQEHKDVPNVDREQER